MMRLPASVLSPSSLPRSDNAAAAISSGSAIRPMPASPASAISPAFGPTTATPSPASCARLRWVAGCSHIRGFIAGATSIGRSVASSTAQARSSAWPPAILASRSAVAGATTIRSASRASLMWPTSNSVVGSNRSVNARSAESALADRGVMNSRAARVRMQRTASPRSFSRRMRSSDLYAAMPPPMIRTTRLVPVARARLGRASSVASSRSGAAA